MNLRPLFLLNYIFFFRYFGVVYLKIYVTTVNTVNDEIVFFISYENFVFPKSLPNFEYCMRNHTD